MSVMLLLLIVRLFVFAATSTVIAVATAADNVTLLVDVGTPAGLQLPETFQFQVAPPTHVLGENGEGSPIWKSPNEFCPVICVDVDVLVPTVGEVHPAL